jgi:hypothetical protein
MVLMIGCHQGVEVAVDKFLLPASPDWLSTVLRSEGWNVKKEKMGEDRGADLLVCPPCGQTRRSVPTECSQRGQKKKDV